MEWLRFGVQTWAILILTFVVPGAVVYARGGSAKQQLKVGLLCFVGYLGSCVIAVVLALSLTPVIGVLAPVIAFIVFLAVLILFFGRIVRRAFQSPSTSRIE